VVSRRKYLFLMVPAVFQVLALGLLSHGESRFVFFPLALIVVAAAMLVDQVIAGSRASIGTAVSWGLIVLLAGSLGLSAAQTRRTVAHRASVNLPVETAARVAASETGAESCAVMTSYTPQVTYYSGCWTAIFHPNLEPEDAVNRLQGQAKFMILIDGGKRQPEASDLAGLVALTEGPPIVIDQEGGTARVFEFEG
jgi:hypothetical protein